MDKSEKEKKVIPKPKNKDTKISGKVASPKPPAKKATSSGVKTAVSENTKTKKSTTNKSKGANKKTENKTSNKNKSGTDTKKIKPPKQSPKEDISQIKKDVATLMSDDVPRSAIVSVSKRIIASKNDDDMEVAKKLRRLIYDDFEIDEDNIQRSAQLYLEKTKSKTKLK